MRLAEFILVEMQSILDEWDSFARTMEPAASSMTSEQLRDHAAVILKSIAADLRTSQTRNEEIAKSHGHEPPSTQASTGEEHGLGRFESLFTIEQVVSEYRALRSSVLRLWQRAGSFTSADDIDDIIRFNEAIDQLLASSVLSFAQGTREALEAEGQRKEQFLAMLAHELRNPLAPISAAASLLKMANSDKKVTHNASNIISRQVAHMASLVNDLLDVSRVTRGAIELELETLDLRQVIEDAVEQVMPEVQGRQHLLEVVELSQPIVMLGDRKRLVQVFANLLANAAKYTPRGGHIQLKLEWHEEQVGIVVEDNGIGMTADFVPHAFDLFAQAVPTSDRSSGGLGLGLRLVKSLVDLHQGTVTCSSAGLGTGSRFTVRLPRPAGDERFVERRRASRVQLLAQQQLKVMVVDDNVDAAETLSLLLQAAGYQVVTQHDARHALQAAQSELPDVFVLDIGLPDMDGNELARRLRAYPDTAGKLLIALTGYTEANNGEESFKAGFDYYLTKPVDIARFQTILGSLTAT